MCVVRGELGMGGGGADGGVGGEVEDGGDGGVRRVEGEEDGSYERLWWEERRLVVGRVERLKVGGAGGLEVRDRLSEAWGMFGCSWLCWWDGRDSMERISRVVRGTLSKRV